jgi:hypothetical protein
MSKVIGHSVSTTYQSPHIYELANAYYLEISILKAHITQKDLSQVCEPRDEHIKVT